MSLQQVAPSAAAKVAPVVEERKQVNASCLEFLILEMVPLSLRVTTELETESPIRDYHFGGVEQIADLQLVRNENNNERIEQYGFSVGKSLLEYLMYEKSEAQDFKNVLNIMKLIARDIWKSMYLKQIDNLRTNHRGTFVLVDSRHRLVSRFDSNEERLSKLDIINLYLRFDSGVIRGVLKQCSMSSSVDAEYKTDGTVHYTIVLQQPQQQ